MLLLLSIRTFKRVGGYTMGRISDRRRILHTRMKMANGWKIC
jgi:hypothetical protein